MMTATLKKQFERAKNMLALNNSLKDFLKAHHISTFVFTYYSSRPGNKNKVKYDYVTDNIRAWHEYYLSQNFEEVDSDLKKARQTILPIYWEIKQQLKEAKAGRETQLRQESLGMNIEKGLSIPLHGPQDDFAILLLQQRHGEAGLNNYEEKEMDWLALGYLYYNYARKLLAHQKPKQLDTDLSPRELQALYLVSQGYQVAEISNQMSISERTVNFHLQNINKKLGTRNKYQSVQVAQAQGLLT